MKIMIWEKKTMPIIFKGATDHSLNSLHQKQQI